MEYNLRLQWLKIDQKCIISQNLKIKNTNLSSVCLYGTDFSETTLATLKKIIVSTLHHSENTPNSSEYWSSQKCYKD